MAAFRVQGTVRADGTGRGDVLVSNGEDVVRTAADGSYALFCDPDFHPFVMVTTPAGWRAADSFYVPLPAADGRLDFELVPAPERAADAFRVAQITDLHVVEDGVALTAESTVAEDLAALQREADPDFLVASGDLTNRGSDGELAALSRALATATRPVFPLFGGHDGNQERFAEVPDGQFVRNYQRHLGPTRYSLDWGRTHWVFYPQEDGFFAPQDRQRKRAWLAADLAAQPAGRLVVLVTHTPPTSQTVRQLADAGVAFVLFGHWHSSKCYVQHGVVVAAAPPLCFGGIDTRPRGYRLLTCAPASVRTTLHALGSPGLRPLTPQRLQLGGAEWALSWVHHLGVGAHRAAPVLAGDRVLLSRADEHHPAASGLNCLAATDGQTRWQLPADAAVKSACALAADVCVALSVTGRLHAARLADGSPLWQADLPGHPERWLYTRPLAAEGRVYAGGKAGYGAFDMETGAPLWYTPLESSDNWSCYASPVLTDQLLVAPIQRRGLVALRCADGTVAWEVPLKLDYQYASPVLAGGLLVCGAQPGHLVAVRPADGALVWDVEALGQAYPTGMCVAGDALLVAAADGWLHCLDAAAGQARWRWQAGPDLLDMTPYRRGGRSLLAAPATCGDAVLVPCQDGVLQALALADGAELGRAEFGAPLSAGVTASSQALVVATFDGRVCWYGTR